MAIVDLDQRDCKARLRSVFSLSGYCSVIAMAVHPIAIASAALAAVMRCMSLCQVKSAEGDQNC